MTNRPYRKAMDQLPFSDDLEARTIAKLQAASDDMVKEEDFMKINKGRSLVKRNKRYAAIGGTLLAAAACLLLVIIPQLNTANEVSVREVPVIGENAVISDSVTLKVANESEDQEVSLPLATSPSTASAPQAAAVDAADTGWSGWDMAMEEDALAESVPAEAGAAFMYGYSNSGGTRIADNSWNTEEYSYFVENGFQSVLTAPLSTFAADVDTASYAKLRSALLSGQGVPADSVRIEEMLNYFSYQYAEPKAGEPFGVTTEIADCPWNPDSKLLLIGLQAEKIDEENIPPQNLVFLIDVSGSMSDSNKLPLVKRAFKLLLEELRPTDTVSIVTYASGDRIVLDGMRASEKTAIMEALDGLSAGGGTAGARGIQTAYELAVKHYIEGGSNRVILATDGDLNIGITDEGSLTRLIEEKRESGVYLSVLGFGMGNYKDNKLEALADHGNGNYAYIDTIYEARKALVEEIGGTFLTIAKDVKLQVEFNPAKVKGYRLIGYENRTMAAQDFANDLKDGGEVGSGHQVTVLYEIVPVDSPMEVGAVETKYQTTVANESDEWLTLNLRCKKPEGTESELFTYPVDEKAMGTAMSDNLRFASAVAETGMLLRDSEYKGTGSYQAVLERLRGTAFVNGDIYKEEFQYLVSLLARSSGE